MNSQNISDHFSFVTGFVQDKDTIRIIAQSDQLNQAGEPNSTLMKFVHSEGKRYDFHLGWYATRLWARNQLGVEVVALGPDGRVNAGDVSGDSTEIIGGESPVAERYGVIRDLRFIGSHYYATGMSRQVYRREKINEWVHCDRGVLQEPSTDPEASTGFNSIDGLSEGDIYAAGFNGELWHFQNSQWDKMKSPTQVVLNKVKVINKDTVFVCGQKGTLFCKIGEGWQIINQKATTEEFWDLEWFQNKLYVATNQGLFYLNEAGALESVNFNVQEKVTCGNLHANYGILLSVGSKHIFVTEDGNTWAKITNIWI